MSAYGLPGPLEYVRQTLGHLEESGRTLGLAKREAKAWKWPAEAIEALGALEKALQCQADALSAVLESAVPKQPALAVLAGGKEAE